MSGTITQKTDKAVKTNVAQQVGETFAVPLSSITRNVNPRTEPATLASMGYVLLDQNDPEHSLLTMCLSEDVEVQRIVVELFETHENNFDPQMAQKEDADYKDAEIAHSICAMASSIDRNGQLEPVAVKKSKSKRADGGYNYTLVFGQRRTSAVAYAFAANCVAEFDNKEVPYPNIKPAMLAIEKRVNDEEAFHLAVAENEDRKNFDPVQEGYVFKSFRDRINPKTGKKWTFKAIAEHFQCEYGHVRNRHSLAMDYVPDQVDDEGNVIKVGQGLTDEQREAVRTGKKKLSWAYKVALRENHDDGNGDRKPTRRKPLTIAKLEALFDETFEDTKKNQDEQYVKIRRETLAECMQIPVSQATKEAKKRIKEREKAEADAA